MKPVLPALALAAALMAAAPAAMAATEEGWPCVQRRTPDLSAAVMWPDPVAPVTLSPAAQDLVGALSLRRVGLDEAETLAGRFVAAEGADPGVLGNVFLAVVERINADRRRILDGIATYAGQQAALTGKIDAARAEMTRLQAAEPPDFDRIDALEEQIDWDERIFLDRERALTYVCETPVLLEKRLYAIAGILRAAAP
jgi:hypothetical protein